MNSRVLAGLLLLFCLSFADAASPWNLCPGAHGHLTVESVTLTPDPPARGKDEIVSLIGTVDETVSGGTIQLTISYLGFTVYNATYEICSSITCPFTGKDISASITVPGSSIPSISPPGTYVGEAILVDQSGASLTCVQVSFVLAASEFSSMMHPKEAAALMARFNGL